MAETTKGRGGDMTTADTLPRCLTTHKIMHPDERSAKKHLAALRRSGQGSLDDNMYECAGCGALHVGRSSRLLVRRIRKATKVGSAKTRDSASRRRRR